MASRNQQILAAYIAFNSATGVLLSGDSANHSLKWEADTGTGSFSQQSTGSAVDTGNGKYAAFLTSTNANCNSGTIVGISSTVGIVLLGTDYTFEQLPVAAPGTAGGVISQGTGIGQINTSNGIVPANSNGSTANVVAWNGNSSSSTLLPVGTIGTSNYVGGAADADAPTILAYLTNISQGLPIIALNYYSQGFGPFGGSLSFSPIALSPVVVQFFNGSSLAVTAYSTIPANGGQGGTLNLVGANYNVSISQTNFTINSKPPGTTSTYLIYGSESIRQSGDSYPIISNISTGTTPVNSNGSTSIVTSLNGANISGSAPSAFFNNAPGIPAGSIPVAVNWQTSAGVPVPGVTYTVTGYGSGTANTSGGASFGLNAGNGYQLVSNSTALNTFPVTTFNVSSVTNLIITGTAFTFPGGNPPGTVQGLAIATDGMGNPQAGVIFSFQLLADNTTDSASGGNAVFSSEATNSSGGVVVQFGAGWLYKGGRGTGFTKPVNFTTPLSGGFQLPTMIGNP